MKRAHDFILENLSTWPSVETIAREAGMSPSSLQRLFKSAYNISVMEQIRRAKLEFARDALASGVARRRAEGVTLLEDSAGDADPEAGPPICKVCGEPIDGGGADPVVVCDACGAPHHLECWRYVGRCSIYGCGSKDAKPLENLRSEP